MGSKSAPGTSIPHSPFFMALVSHKRPAPTAVTESAALTINAIPQEGQSPHRTRLMAPSTIATLFALYHTDRAKSRPVYVLLTSLPNNFFTATRARKDIMCSIFSRIMGHLGGPNPVEYSTDYFWVVVCKNLPIPSQRRYRVRAQNPTRGDRRL